jgi:hypothetical protein
MPKFVPEKEHLRQALLFLFNQKKKAAEYAPLIRKCETWFRQFKNGNLNVKESAKTRNAGSTG